MNKEKDEVFQQMLEKFLAKTPEELHEIDNDPRYDGGLFASLQEMNDYLEEKENKMYRLEIKAGYMVLAEYTGEDIKILLDMAMTDRWIDWHDDAWTDGVIKDDAWRYDHVDRVILWEGDPERYEEKILEITALEGEEEEE